MDSTRAPPPSYNYWLNRGLLDCSLQKLCTTVVFLDYEKAFNKVWRQGLLLKMYQLKFPVQPINIIRVFLSGRWFKVRVNESHSVPHPTKARDSQNSKFSPILFSIYPNDFPSLKRYERKPNCKCYYVLVLIGVSTRLQVIFKTN